MKNRFKRNYFYKGHDHTDADWHFTFEYQTELPAASLWEVGAQIDKWPTVDDRIASVKIDQPPEPGVTFTLKPFKGPPLKMKILRFDPPHLYSDVCHLFMAEMYTTHSFTPVGKETLIKVSIEIDGPLTPIWSRTVGENQARGLCDQTERLLIAVRGDI